MEAGGLLRRSANSIASLTSLGSLASGRNSSNNSLSAGSKECRVCRCGTEFGPLFYPCKCKGSIRYVHEGCLLEWLSVSQSKSCQVCKAEFEFTLLYHNDTPTRLSTLELIAGTLVLGVKTLPTVIRYLSVAVIWLVVFPVSVQNIHELFFATSLDQVKNALFIYNVRFNELFTKCLYGFVLEMIIVCAFLAISTMQESMQRMRFMYQEANDHHHQEDSMIQNQFDTSENSHNEHEMSKYSEESYLSDIQEEDEIDADDENEEEDCSIVSEDDFAQGNIFDIDLVAFDDENNDDIEVDLNAVHDREEQGAEIRGENNPNIAVANNNDVAALDVLLGLRGNFIGGVRNMIFVTLANMAFLVIFQLIPFYIGRFLHPYVLHRFEIKKRLEEGFSLLAAFLSSEEERERSNADQKCINKSFLSYNINSEECTVHSTSLPGNIDMFDIDLDRTYVCLHQMKQEIQDAGTWYAMIVGYVAIVALISLYVLCTNAYTLLKRNKHRYNHNHHIAIVTAYFIHIYMNLYNGVKLASISLIEFVLLGQAIGWVVHIGSLGIFGETLNDMPSHLQTCYSMPQLCFGVHWLVGTLTLTAANMFVNALKKVVRPKYTVLFSVNQLREKFWFVFSRRKRYIDQFAATLDGSWKQKSSGIANKTIKSKHAPFPYDDDSQVKPNVFTEQRHYINSYQIRYSSQTQVKSLNDCLEYSLGVLLISIPVCFLLMVIPIYVVDLLFPSTFPLKLGGNLRNNEVMNTVVVSIDLFLMHTVVPYTLDTIKLGLILTWFIRILVNFFAYRLDMHGCLMRYTNPFGGNGDFIKVKVTVPAEKHRSENCIKSILDLDGGKFEFDPMKEKDQTLCENSDLFIENEFGRKCLNSSAELATLQVGTRVNLLGCVCGTSRWLDNGILLGNLKYRRNILNYLDVLKETAVFALADTSGYAVPVFLSHDQEKLSNNERTLIKEKAKNVSSDIKKAVLFFCKDIGAKDSRGTFLEDLIAEELSKSRANCFDLEYLSNFMTLLKQVEDNGALYNLFCKKYLPPGIGKKFSPDTFSVVAQINTLWEDNNGESSILLAIENALISDKQGRSFVLDAKSKCVIEPDIHKAQRQRTLFDRRKEEGEHFPEGQFCIYRYKPSYVGLRLLFLLLFYFLSSICLCMFIMAIPLLAGRNMFLLASLPLEHDLYHWSVGCATIWGLTYFTSWFVRNTYDQGVRDVASMCLEWMSKKIKLFFCAMLMFILVPILCGLLFDKVVMFPYRYDTSTSPILSIQHNWAVGLALCKILSRLIVIGVFGETEWIQKVEALQDIRGLDRKWLIQEVAKPILIQLGIRLCVPYAFARFCGSYMNDKSAEKLMCFSFPVFSGLLLIKDCFYILTDFLDKVHDTVRDQRYIVGKKLKNYTIKLREAGNDVQRFIEVDLIGIEEDDGN